MTLRQLEVTKPTGGLGRVITEETLPRNCGEVFGVTKPTGGLGRVITQGDVIPVTHIPTVTKPTAGLGR